MLLERRVLKRHNIFICVNFRSLIKSAQYSFGITNDFTRQGFNFESQDHGINPGQNIEIIFRHPKTDVAVNVPGELVWKKKKSDSIFLTGVRFNDLDKATKSKMLEIVSTAVDIPVESFNDKHNDSDVPSNELSLDENAAIWNEFTAMKDAESKSNDVQEEQLVEETSNKAGKDVPSNGLSLEENAAIWDEFTAMCEDTEEYKQTEEDEQTEEDMQTDKDMQREENEEENMVHDQASDFNNGEIEDESKQITTNRETHAGDSTMGNKRKRKGRVLLFIPVAAALLLAAVIALPEKINSNYRSLFSAITESTARQEADMEKPVLILGDAETNDITEKEPLYTKHIQTQEKSNLLFAKRETEAYPVKVPEENSNYFIQVGTWRNIEYAQEMLTQLKKDYPETYIVKIFDVHKIRIPGILNKKQGAIISKDIEDKFNLKPLIVLKTQ